MLIYVLIFVHVKVNYCSYSGSASTNVNEHVLGSDRTGRDDVEINQGFQGSVRVFSQVYSCEVSQD